jgi:hypothetical protein
LPVVVLWVRRPEQGVVAKQWGVGVTVMYMRKAQFGHWWNRWLVCHGSADGYADAGYGDFAWVEWMWLATDKVGKQQNRVMSSWPALLLIEKQA